MKRLLSAVLSAAMLCAAPAVTAKSGDIAGFIYSTDIKACINGVWVDSYNIGGRTVVIVEDITNQYKYSNALRTLEIDDFAPERLNVGTTSYDKKPGEAVGRIYETNIKTYFRGKELNAYSLNGKMAVVIEELGDDGGFSDIGGKYIWNPKNRTITLESMYRYPYSMRSMMEEKHYNIVLTEAYGKLEAMPKEAPLDGGYILCEKEISKNAIVPVVYNGETIGYRCSFAQNKFELGDNGEYYLKEIQTPVDYFYTDKVSDMIFQAGEVRITAEDWLRYFELHTSSTVKDSFETDEYIFLYMHSNYIMKGADRLIKLNKADGTKTEYQDLIGTDIYKNFENVTIDEEKEKVYVTYGGEYVIDLKSGELTDYINLDTAIGGGDAPTEIVISDMAFADELNAQMPSDENYMFSPLSIKTALALVANGADGETESEILSAVEIKNIDDFNALSKDFTEKYSQTDILSLSMANSVWINKDKTTQKFSGEFEQIASEYYGATAKSVSGKNAAHEINSWVSDKTDGRIPQVLHSGDDFWAMLVNAIYFKGAWQDEFNEDATKADKFISADGASSQIDFMNKTEWINYTQTKSAEIIELPYKNRADKFDEKGEYLGSDVFDDIDVSMYVIAAENDINPAAELEAAIEGGSFERRYIKLSLPKFKIEYEASLNEMLMNMGIVSAFSENGAQFEKMFDNGNMAFTGVRHKTFITVDEKGTEAAAVTAIGMAGSALPPEPYEIKFNKPFYFVIRDNAGEEILFMGRYAYAG